MASPHATNIPIFWGHGTMDPLVKFQFGRESAEFLTKQLGIKKATETDIVGLNFNAYEGVLHSTNQKELDDLRVWLKKALPKE
jgi:lysophospholipase I